MVLTVVLAAIGLGGWSIFDREIVQGHLKQSHPALEVQTAIEHPVQASSATALDTEALKAIVVERAAALSPPPTAERPRWIENAVASKPANGRPMIAVVIDDMGVDRRRSARAIDLPGPLTVSFLPYAQDLRSQTAEARRRGHELLVHVPMEATDRSANPGPNALLTTLPSNEVLRRLQADLAAFDGYVGVNNHMGSRFTSDRNAMEPVLEELKRQGLLFLDSRTGPSVGANLAKALDLPHASRDIFIDHDVSPRAVAESLRKLEAVARRSGQAIGIGHPKDETLDQLARWLPSLDVKGFALVPISAMVRKGRTEGEIRTGGANGSL